MLARRVKINLPDGNFIETPILLPAFSSRGFSDIQDILKGVREIVSGPALISAYDIYYKRIQADFSFVKPVIFIDSGGYESFNTNEIIEHNKSHSKKLKWSINLYKKTIRKVIDKFKMPKVIVGYDRNCRLTQQIEFNEDLFAGFEKNGGQFLKEILLKPESQKQTYLNINKITANIKKLKKFDIIGVTEKELGDCLLKRMKNLSAIRKVLSDNSMPHPIHVFGSLDTVVTPLYFFCGADIFDGLTWLRYSYLRGLTVYQPNCWIDKFSVDTNDYYLRLATFMNNYHYIREMELQMKAFVKNKDFSVFNDRPENFIDRRKLFEKVLENLD